MSKPSEWADANCELLEVAIDFGRWPPRVRGLVGLALDAALAEGERRGREAERREAAARVTLTELWHSGPATEDIVRRVHELILKVKP
jgi:hypothetical protein